MLFSVLIANYNNGAYLKDALLSVIKQTYDNWEVVIVDDQSTDNGFDLERQANKDPRIKFFQNKVNKGCGFTKAKCIELAKGDICGFLDGDDALTANALEIMVNKHISYPDASLIYSQSYLCDESLNRVKLNDKIGAIKDGDTYLDSLFGAPLVNHFATFKRKCYNSTLGIRKNLKRAVDQDLYYKLEEVGDLIYVEQPLYFYRYFRNKGMDGISTGPNSILLREYYFSVIHATIHRRIKNNQNVNEETINTYTILVNDFFISKIKKSNHILEKIRALMQSFKYGGFKDRFNYRVGLLFK
jgi:glycosyltransferase involved in cell wall biosynthesis